MKRRALLASVSGLALSSLAGCSARSETDPPAGSLRFENRDDLQHVISVRVTGVGSEPGMHPRDPERPPNSPLVRGDMAVPSTQRTLTASQSLAPDESHTFPAVFTDPVYYGIEFTVDGTIPDPGGLYVYHPAPPERDGWSILSGTIFESGDFSWENIRTDNPGTFQ